MVVFFFRFAQRRTFAAFKVFRVLKFYERALLCLETPVKSRKIPRSRLAQPALSSKKRLLNKTRVKSDN